MEQGETLDRLTTEQRNPASEAIDSLSAAEIVDLINREDRQVAEAVGKQKAAIAAAIERIAACVSQDGRLIYLGAGTSGRLGVLDAAECPPTFNTPPELVVGVIAGGPTALTQAVEGAEDHPEIAERDLAAIELCAKDLVVGIATSGRTPYVVGGLNYARNLGCFTVGLTCNQDSALVSAADLMIAPVVGPEVISGSTRMKAGTATKMVLNMLTTGAMVRLGKTYGNLMVDLRATNSKLLVRSRRIIATLTSLCEADAEALLQQCDGEVKTAVVAQLRGVSASKARELLQRHGGHLPQALGERQR